MVTIKEEYYTEYAVRMEIHTGRVFPLNTPGMVLETVGDLCLISWLPVGMYPVEPALAVHKKYLTEI